MKVMMHKTLNFSYRCWVRNETNNDQILAVFIDNVCITMEVFLGSFESLSLCNTIIINNCISNPGYFLLSYLCCSCFIWLHSAEFCFSDLEFLLINLHPSMPFLLFCLNTSLQLVQDAFLESDKCIRLGKRYQKDLQWIINLPLA